MRKRMIIVGLVALSVQNPERVEAGAFASEVTQLLNHAQLVMQYIRQGTQVANHCCPAKLFRWRISLIESAVEENRRFFDLNFFRVSPCTI